MQSSDSNDVKRGIRSYLATLREEGIHLGLLTAGGTIGRNRFQKNELHLADGDRRFHMATALKILTFSC